MALNLTHIELKRVNQALEAQIRSVESTIEKRKKMIEGVYKTANKDGKFNKVTLQNKNEESEDKIISLVAVQTKVKEEIRRLEGAEVASLRRA